VEPNISFLWRLKIIWIPFLFKEKFDCAKAGNRVRRGALPWNVCLFENTQESIKTNKQEVLAEYARLVD